MNNGWIGVDLDGVLAYYDGWKGADKIGDPIPAMMCRVKEWLKNGQEIKIFTARAIDKSQIPPVEKWLEDHGLPKLEVTCVKDPGMINLWDDRCVQMAPNLGVPVQDFVSSEIMENLNLHRANNSDTHVVIHGWKLIQDENSVHHGKYMHIKTETVLDRKDVVTKVRQSPYKQSNDILMTVEIDDDVYAYRIDADFDGDIFKEFLRRLGDELV